jgi:HSP20 family molecular chaperone IbpA
MTTLFPYSTIFDEFFNEAVDKSLRSDNNSYPKFNIYETEDGERVFISLAVTGIPREKIEVYINDDGNLVIESNVEKDNRKYIVKGYPIKSFKRIFVFDKKYEVQNVVHENGELIVEFVRKEPKKRQIPILPGNVDYEEAA